MKKESFLDYLIKNRWVILCLIIVFILIRIGVVRFLLEVLITVALIVLMCNITDYIVKKFKKNK